MPIERRQWRSIAPGARGAATALAAPGPSQRSAPEEGGLRTLGATAKRAIDVVGAAVGLFVLAPFLLLIALVVRWRLGLPVLFRQLRPACTAGRSSCSSFAP